MKTFLTIITADYFGYGLCLYQSLLKYDSSVELQLFVSHGELSVSELEEVSNHKSLSVVSIKNHGLCEKCELELREKYHKDDPDAYRWSMKSVLLIYLLDNNHSKVIYVDCDIHFFNNYNFLFDKLDNCNVLLSPHWRSRDPSIDEHNFNLMYQDGIFNGGFIGVSTGAQNAMFWWFKCCIYACEVDKNRGRFVDQKFLDAMPSFFDDVGIIKHQGCNIANWNIHECKRVIDGDGKLHVNDKYEIIFVHFTKSIFQGFLSGADPNIGYLIQSYSTRLSKYLGYNIFDKEKERYNSRTNKRPSFREKIGLRTRFKRIFSTSILSK